MNLVFEHIDEAIKHLKPRSQEEIQRTREDMLLTAGYRPELKEQILEAIEKELGYNEAHFEVRFNSSVLKVLKYFIENNFKTNFMAETFLIDELRLLIKKYKI